MILHLDSVSLPLRNATVTDDGLVFFWTNHGLTWSDNESVAVRLTEYPQPNAYGYRTIWTALMTAGDFPRSTAFGYSRISSLDVAGELTNDLMVVERDETVTIGTVDQPRFPWTGYKIIGFSHDATHTYLRFDSSSYPSTDEVAAWTLTFGGGLELPFANAEFTHANLPYSWKFTGVPSTAWAAGDQVLVSIRTREVQNRFGQVELKAGRSTTVGSDGNIVYGKVHSTYPRGDNTFGPSGSWRLERLRVTIDQTDEGVPRTGDTDPVWITATFRAPNAGTGYQGWWEGQFEE